MSDYCKHCQVWFDNTKAAHQEVERLEAELDATDTAMYGRLCGENRRLKEEITRLKDERDRLHDVYLAEKDIRHLNLMSKQGRIDVNQFKAAEESLELTLKDCEKYYENASRT